MTAFYTLKLTKLASPAVLWIPKHVGHSEARLQKPGPVVTRGICYTQLKVAPAAFCKYTWQFCPSGPPKVFKESKDSLVGIVSAVNKVLLTKVKSIEPGPGREHATFMGTSSCESSARSTAHLVSSCFKLFLQLLVQNNLLSLPSIIFFSLV